MMHVWCHPSVPNTHTHTHTTCTGTGTGTGTGTQHTHARHAHPGCRAVLRAGRDARPPLPGGAGCSGLQAGAAAGSHRLRRAGGAGGIHAAGVMRANQACLATHLLKAGPPPLAVTGLPAFVVIHPHAPEVACPQAFCFGPRASSSTRG